MPRIRLAVIGYGNRSRQTYCPLLHSLSDRIELSALVEVDEGRRAQAMGVYAFGEPSLGGDAQRRAARRCAGAGAGGIPRRGHLALLLAGVDVYTEKPDTWKLAEARELVTLGAEEGCVYQVGQNRLFMATIRRAREFFADTPVNHIAVEKSKRVAPAGPEYFLDDGIHVLSPLMHLAGDISEVLSAVHVPGRVLSAHFRLATGGSGVLTQHVDAGYWVERFQLHGAGKSANIITPDVLELYDEQQQVGSSPWAAPAAVRPGRPDGLPEAVTHFLDCAESRREPVGSTASLLRVHEVMNEVPGRESRSCRARRAAEGRMGGWARSAGGTHSRTHPAR